MTSYYLTLRAYGDCVISYGLLEKLPVSASLCVLGTPASQLVAQVLGFNRFPVEPVLFPGPSRRADDVAAFFDVRNAGVRRALADLCTVHRALDDTIKPGDRVLFEQADWRNRWVLPRVPHVAALAPEHRATIYHDRLEMLDRVFGPLPPLRPSRAPPAAVRRLVLNPGARLEYKRLPRPVVENIVSHAAAHGIEVCLLDPEERHSHLAARVGQHLPRPRLADAITLLRGADLYIGADSFFLHLAYYFDKPAFAIVPVPQPYFAPPSLSAIGGVLPIAEAMDARAIGQALDAFCTGKSVGR